MSSWADDRPPARARVLAGVVAALAAVVLAGGAGAVTGANTITTVAGRSQFPGYAGDGGPARRALFGGISGIAVDVRGNLYIADTAGWRIRKVDPRGTITTFGCNGLAGSTGDGGPARSARCRPVGIAVDTAGTVYFSDGDGNRVRSITPTGRITAFAGAGGPPGSGGDGGPATAAQLNAPRGVAVDEVGNVYIADVENHRVRRVTRDGMITTFAGIGAAGFSGDGGPATSARLAGPFDVATDRGGNVYIADTSNRRVRKVAPSGTITTLASIAPPLALAVGVGNELYVAATARVRRVTPAGTVAVVAGNGRLGFSGDGGPAARARMVGVLGLAVDRRGNLYISDGENRRIRKVWRGRVPR
jgi:sugar lactone lactonase YvrE